MYGRDSIKIFAFSMDSFIVLTVQSGTVMVRFAAPRGR